MAGRRSTAVRSTTWRLLKLNSGDVRTFIACALAFEAASIAGAISSGVAASYTASSWRKLRASKRLRPLAGAAKSPSPAVKFGGNGWAVIYGIHSGLSAVIVGRCIGGLRYRHAPYPAALRVPGRYQRAEGDGSQSDNRGGRYVCEGEPSLRPGTAAGGRGRRGDAHLRGWRSEVRHCVAEDRGHRRQHADAVSARA